MESESGGLRCFSEFDVSFPSPALPVLSELSFPNRSRTSAQARFSPAVEQLIFQGGFPQSLRFGSDGRQEGLLGKVDPNRNTRATNANTTIHGCDPLCYLTPAKQKKELLDEPKASSCSSPPLLFFHRSSSSVSHREPLPLARFINVVGIPSALSSTQFSPCSPVNRGPPVSRLHRLVSVIFRLAFLLGIPPVVTPFTLALTAVSITSLPPPSHPTMAAISKLIIRDDVAHQLVKRANFASRNPGVILVFCIVGIVGIGLAALFIHRKWLARRAARTGV
ncbi:predicted protein [Uncinocarpus reesii 1704]|uniref:Uncharacterized protein n=1 Tax=Uncinocarpus reesii (strain UAMH 1704) TaxID=336963 RepID=C4JPG1_UNCRE|nr:uncharacterized protein UREG_04543 [Uncinocarpus reesii 1704]EEP79697.1 predicted protein [Uncinocarpus reesii 1704]